VHASNPGAARAALPRRAATWIAFLALASILTAGPAVAAGDTGAPKNDPIFFQGNPGRAKFRALCEGEIKAAQKSLDQMLAVKGKRTIANTLEPYNMVTTHADNAGGMSGLMEVTHPDSAFRATAEALTQAASRFQTDLSLNRKVYDALAAVDLSAADTTTKYYVWKTLRDFRLAGVDKDEATRKKIAALRERLVEIGQDFDRNIRNDSRTIQVTAAQLAGMPPDFMASHPAGPDGKITIGIEYPDLFPIMAYAQDSDVRRRLTFERLNRAYPANMAVLDSMILTRDELANTLGYPEWADYVTADKMIGNATNAQQFITRLGNLTRTQADQEYQVYLKAKQRDVPGATAVDRWEARYYERIIRARDYQFDAESARVYFPFESVKKGVLDVTSRIFSVSFKRIPNAAVWDPSVEAYEVWENGRLIGRFFLDLHPRPGKFNHAEQVTIHSGVRGVQIPQGALLCNFPGGKPGDPGLMEHGDVTTFFHEFGHLLHTIFGGDQRWESVSGITTEWDFVEAPSQMLEEWAWDPNVLRTFAKNYQTDEPIPVSMVENMRRADKFGRAIDTAYQVFFAAISLDIYDQAPKDVDTDAIVAKEEKAYVPFPETPGTHMQTSFGHLDGYSAIYYTYMWSLVIAKDLFTQFDKSNLLDPTVPTRYREEVLDPGGTQPAAQLVHNFLGRDFNYTAFENYLKGKD
jgi:thimet oligopeptidase